ncbi:hypothetical protein [Bacillus sp. V5-8f]|uniref:hypothetical protein n=1 Tax=Bacillus sp. V5-8f TaxID=2053044 RepID=UPI0021554F4A|nr:hypothetical protein [Bacillus sp. V5-8f]
MLRFFGTSNAELQYFARVGLTVLGDNDCSGLAIQRNLPEAFKGSDCSRDTVAGLRMVIEPVRQVGMDEDWSALSLA